MTYRALVLAALFALPTAAFARPAHAPADAPLVEHLALKGALAADPTVLVDPAAAADATLPPGPGTDLCLRLSDHWTLHPLGALSVVSFDLTHGTVNAGVNVTGLFEARYKNLFGIAGGLGVQTGPATGATATVLATLPIPVAVGVQYQWVGAEHAVSVIAAPTFRF